MEKTLFRTAAVALAAGLAGIGPARAQTCTVADTAPRNLMATSLLDAFVNPPDREDQGFIERSSGIPNIFILLSNATSMRRLPPDGPASYGALPPLQDAQCTGTGDAADPACANKLLVAFDADCPTGVGCAVMGCGLDPVSQAYAGTGAIAFLASRTYAPPCGSSLSGTQNRTYQYQGTVIDYASEASVCPYFVPSSNSTSTGKDGYDPDHYCETGTSPCTKKKFFDGARVYHDAVVDPDPGVPDGWTDAGTSPWSSGNQTSVDDFCTSTYKTAFQGTQRKAEICTTCLTQRGFLLDGRLLRKAPATGSSAPGSAYPSIWLSGNYLNFYPPKFMVARKVMKDVISNLRDIRMGFAQFNATGADPTNNKWQALSPSCQDMDGSNFSASRGAFVNYLNQQLHFDAGTPLARALLDIGQYYHSPSNEWFASNLPSLGTTWNGMANANQSSVCYSCQTSSVLAITDGIPGAGDGNALPPGGVTAAQVDTLMAGSSATGVLPDVSGATRTGGIPDSLCSRCNAFPAAEDWKNHPARVAWYLHNLDLRNTGDPTLDCAGNGGKQTLNVYTVGFATQSISDANAILTNTARMGGGFFSGADTPGGLRDAITNVLSDIVERSTSFSVATVSTLQTTSGHSVIVPRFDPDKDSLRWRGHLSRYELYSEFLNPCVETADGRGDGDLDCDGKCQSVFLTDADGAFISEDSDGIFRKNEPNAPYCIQAPLCASRGKTCGTPGTAPAKAWWDAATVMSGVSDTDPRAWDDRYVYTVVDDSGPSGAPDGKIDASDTVFRLQATAPVAASLAPYLGDTATLCSDVADLIATAGDGDTAAAVRSDASFCVQEIIRFLLGADVFNEQVLPADLWRKGPTGQDQLPDRAFLLGDVFHSSPVVMDPPPPANGILCPNGLHNQCLTSLWQTPVPSTDAALDGHLNAYQRYAESPLYGNRRKVILVGANDGFLHAIDGGTWHDGDDPVTRGLDESLPPFNGHYDRGTGGELWAFMPPDMLGKVRLYLRPLRHQLFVDGSPMVRDVWVDGTSNRLAGTHGLLGGARDGKKQAAEFHTVAVVGERRGGTRYFALDVTDATALPGGDETVVAPKLLWMYPQPDDRETVTFGETYTDFLPVGPPIGPVRVAASTWGAAATTSTPTMAVNGVATPVPYNERWVTFLSGGFDPMYLRGRGVHMVDVWTGEEVLDFSYDAGATATGGCPDGATDLRCKLRYPVPATVGMVMWGQTEQRLQSFANDGYFDTATFGDAGGQLWVLRFSQPGTLDPTTRRATNWTGARVMAMPGCAAQPFFYLTANVAVRQGYYRVLAGTGDRYNLLDLNGGQCDPDNPRACALRGCTVTMSSQVRADGAGGISRSMTLHPPSACAVSTTGAAETPAACAADGTATVTIACPSPTSTSTRSVTVSCAARPGGYLCTPTTAATGVVSPSGTITQGNWYVSLRVFDAAGGRGIFSDAAGAQTYDENKLGVSAGGTTAGVVVIDGADGAALPSPLARHDGKGWALWYRHDGPITVSDHVYSASRVDERTSSTSAVYGAVYWNTTQPSQGDVTRAANPSCTMAARCVASGRRLTYHYGANVETGGPVLRDDSGALIRSVKNVTLVPAMGDQPTVFVNQKGQIQVGLTAVNPERGATNVFAGEGLDPLSEYGTVEMSRDAHACRHAATQEEAEARCR